MFENHTFFKGPEGGIYGVSPRVINAGFSPPEGHTSASQEEIEAFLQRIVDNQALPRPQTPEDFQVAAVTLQEKGVFPHAIKKITGVDIDELSKKDLKRIKALKDEREALKESVTIKEEIIEPEQPAKVSKTPADRRRELHRERRAAKAKELERKELEENIFFDDVLTDDELILMETLQFQGFNMNQIRNILVAKRAKKEE